eukprot:GILI01013755.1.p1 GENE.GILI01013755.1~~GILI01013755.1.p1  ORF type:complete len:275 (+),score=31.45 GILI01013755.1:109-933(+)
MSKKGGDRKLPDVRGTDGQTPVMYERKWKEFLDKETRLALKAKRAKEHGLTVSTFDSSSPESSFDQTSPSSSPFSSSSSRPDTTHSIRSHLSHLSKKTDASLISISEDGSPSNFKTAALDSAKSPEPQYDIRPSTQLSSLSRNSSMSNLSQRTLTKSTSLPSIFSPSSSSTHLPKLPSSASSVSSSNVSSKASSNSRASGRSSPGLAKGAWKSRYLFPIDQQPKTLISASAHFSDFSSTVLSSKKAVAARQAEMSLSPSLGHSPSVSSLSLRSM